MKYVKSLGEFPTEKFSIDETITEISDVVGIAEIMLKGISSISDNVKHDLKFVLNNLQQVEPYLACIRKKVDKALKFVPLEIQEKEYL